MSNTRTFAMLGALSAGIAVACGAFGAHALKARLDVDLDARVRRRLKEVLRDLGTDKKREEQMKDDIEKLQYDHSDLKARVAKIEAKSRVEKKKKKSPKVAEPKKAAPKTSRRR